MGASGSTRVRDVRTGLGPSTGFRRGKYVMALAGEHSELGTGSIDSRYIYVFRERIVRASEGYPLFYDLRLVESWRRG